MTRLPLVLAMALGCHCLSLHAAAETVLGTVSVEAEAIAEPSDETASQTTLTAEQLSRDMARNVKDALRYEPGVSVTNNPSRFGLGNLNIRGVEGNRVVMQVDGVPLPDAFKTGGFANANRNLVDVRLLKRIELHKGSASTLYGSGALGGAVNYVTPEPEDWLADGRDVGGGLEALYHGANDAKALLPTLAVGNERFRLLVRALAEEAGEQATMGTRDVVGVQRTTANPQDDSLHTGLLKLVYTPSPALRSALTLEGYARETATHVLSIVRGLTKDAWADDQYRRRRLSLDQRITDLPLGQLDIKLYRQTSHTRQDTEDIRLPTSLIRREFDVEQDITGLHLAFDSVFEARGAHRLLWGLEAARRNTVQLRDGYEYVIATGEYDKTVSPGYPDRDFPISVVDELGLYAQDSWMLSEDWTALLGLRYDRTRLKPEADPVFLGHHRPPADWKDPPVPQSVQAFTPKLGAVWRFAAGYELKGQYAWGFRAPPYDSVNYGFSNPGEGYVSISNPDLKPEYSQGPELTLKRGHAGGWWSLTVFETRYRNFIENEELDCPGDPLCDPTAALTFQHINLDKVRIRGLEAGFSQALSPRWRLRGSLAYARGRDGEGEAIDSVNPFNGVLGLEYTGPGWTLDAVLTLARGKEDKDARHNDDGDLERLFLPKGYGVLDVRVHRDFAKTGRLSVGVLNVLDRKYTPWADVPVRDPAHVWDSGFGPDRYSQPGRHVAVSLSYTF